MVVTFVVICAPRVVVMVVAICVPRVVVLVRSTFGWPEFVYAGCKFVFGELHFEINFFLIFPKFPMELRISVGQASRSGR